MTRREEHRVVESRNVRLRLALDARSLLLLSVVLPVVVLLVAAALAFGCGMGEALSVALARRLP